MSNTRFNETIRTFHQLRKQPQQLKKIWHQGKWMWRPICIHCKQINEQMDQANIVACVCDTCKKIITYYNDLIIPKLCHNPMRKRTYSMPYSIDYVKFDIKGNYGTIKMNTLQFANIQRDIGEFLYKNNLSDETRQKINYVNCIITDLNQATALVHNDLEYLNADYSCNEQPQQMLKDHVAVGGYMVVDYITTMQRYNLHFVATAVKES